MDVKEVEMSEFIKVMNEILRNCTLVFTFEADITFKPEQLTSIAGAQLYSDQESKDIIGQFLLYNFEVIAVYHHPDQYNILFKIADIYVFVSRVYTHYRIKPFRTVIKIYKHL